MLRPIKPNTLNYNLYKYKSWNRKLAIVLLYRKLSII